MACCLVMHEPETAEHCLRPMRARACRKLCGRDAASSAICTAAMHAAEGGPVGARPAVGTPAPGVGRARARPLLLKVAGQLRGMRAGRGSGNDTHSPVISRALRPGRLHDRYFNTACKESSQF